VLSQYQHVTNGRTDRQTDMPTIAKLHSSIAERDKTFQQTQNISLVVL